MHFLLLIFANAFVSCFVLVYWQIALFQVWFSIMRSAFNLLVFPNSMFTPIFIWKGYVLSGEIVLKNNHYNNYYYYVLINKPTYNNGHVVDLVVVFKGTIISRTWCTVYTFSKHVHTVNFEFSIECTYRWEVRRCIYIGNPISAFIYIYTYICIYIWWKKHNLSVSSTCWFW